ncbi:hypothetical protein JCM5296_001935 [Sporobolomyces johnsonii]
MPDTSNYPNSGGRAENPLGGIGATPMTANEKLARLGLPPLEGEEAELLQAYGDASPEMKNLIMMYATLRTLSLFKNMIENMIEG